MANTKEKSQALNLKALEIVRERIKNEEDIRDKSWSRQHMLADIERELEREINPPKETEA